MAAPLRGPALRLSQLAILGLWAWGIACFFLDPASAGWVSVGRWAAIGLLVAHALELPVHVPKLRRAGEPVAAHLVPLMIFGAVHFFSLEIDRGAKAG